MEPDGAGSGGGCSPWGAPQALAAVRLLRALKYKKGEEAAAVAVCNPQRTDFFIYIPLISVRPMGRNVSRLLVAQDASSL